MGLCGWLKRRRPDKRLRAIRHLTRTLNNAPYGVKPARRH
ncbi:Hypothetical protein ABZS17H1_03920 [Kosakonia cowanii]